MLYYRYLMPALCCLLLCSCTSLRESAKYKFNDGIYRTRPLSSHRVEITTVGDTIGIARLRRNDQGKEVADSNHVIIYTSTLKTTAGPPPARILLYNGSFDLDFITFLAKYRPAQGKLPPAMHTTTYNGALYLGYRIDEYSLHYDKSPLHLYKRDVNHIGYSIGFFTGIGASPLNPDVTEPSISYSYDGFILSSGFAFTAAVQNITVGVAVGQDRLMDSNHYVWIYQKKPWIGFGLGLNLN